MTLPIRIRETQGLERLLLLELGVWKSCGFEILITLNNGINKSNKCVRKQESGIGIYLFHINPFFILTYALMRGYELALQPVKKLI